MLGLADIPTLVITALCLPAHLGLGLEHLEGLYVIKGLDHYGGGNDETPSGGMGMEGTHDFIQELWR